MQNVLDYFKNSVALFPDKTAVSDGELAYSYAELDSLSSNISSYIKGKMSGNTIFAIGIFVHRSSDSLLAILSAIKSGGFYVPLDPKTPSEKLEKIINTSEFKVIIGYDEDESLIPESYKDTFSDISELKKMSEDNISRAEDATDISDGSVPLYMIFTSGSTGTPKGVLKTHGSVISFIEAYTKEFDFSDNEIIGNQTPFFFDASAKDIYLAWKLGATIEIIPEGMFTLPPALIRYLNDKKVSFISWVPSALAIITQLNTFEEVKPETIRSIFFVGESFPMKQFKKWHEALPGVSFVNLYGASELAGICCFYRVPEDISQLERLPIGKPLNNCEVMLYKDGDMITAPYVTGEILLRSKALFKEYYKDLHKTEASFIKVLGKTWFKTGDLAFYDSDGNLNFSSRNDFQIKHMGQRIELGEIESICLTLPEIEKACCLYNEDKKRIYLFCELTDIANDDQKSLLIKLKNHLVSYMMPQRVVIKEKLPLNANGKTDRQLLASEMK